MWHTVTRRTPQCSSLILASFSSTTNKRAFYVRAILGTLMILFVFLSLMRDGILGPGSPKRYNCVQRLTVDNRSGSESRQSVSSPAAEDVEHRRGCICGAENKDSRTGNRLCSDPRASGRSGQKVVSFSLYNMKQQWMDGIGENVRGVERLYAGWEMRVYHDVQRGSPFCAQLCQLRDASPRLQLCFMGENEELFGWKVADVFPMLWRFLPMVDDGVAAFVSRDLDSRIAEREVAAVREWLESGRTLHVMRDHPEHNAPILGGMWGSSLIGRDERRLNASRRELEGAFRSMLDVAGYEHCKNLDQEVLSTSVWRRFVDSGDYVDHSSHHCQGSFGSVSIPFPTRRNVISTAAAASVSDGPSFVGQPAYTFGESSPIVCPKECRKNPAWEFC